MNTKAGIPSPSSSSPYQAPVLTSNSPSGASPDSFLRGPEFPPGLFSATLREFQITVDGIGAARSLQQLNEFAKDRASGGGYLLMYVTLKNNGNQPSYLEANNFKLTLGERQYDVDLTATMYASGNSTVGRRQFSMLEPVGPGLSQAGILVFNVPKDPLASMELKVIYSVISGGPVATIKMHN